MPAVLVGAVLQVLLPAVVAKVKEKLAEKPMNGFPGEKEDIKTSEVAGTVAKIVVSSHLTWLGMAIAMLGVIVQYQELFIPFIPTQHLGWWSAGIGFVTLLLKNFATGDVEKKVEDVTKF